MSDTMVMDRAGDVVALGLAARRRRLGRTQKVMGEAIGVDQATVSRAEMGRGAPHLIRRLHQELLRLERQEEQECGDADTFWNAVGEVPHRATVLGRIERVARILMAGTLADRELAMQLVACLPDRVRRRVYRGARRE